MKKTAIAVLMIMLSVLLVSCKSDETVDYDTLNAAFICGDKTAEYDAFNTLNTSMAASLTVTKVTSGEDLSAYDLAYVDKSAVNGQQFDADNIVKFTENGGSVFIDNALYNSFPADFIGASEFVKVENCPVELSYPECGGNIKRIQTLLYDFISLYKDYSDYELLSQCDYGYGIIPSTAQTVASYNGLSLYTLNRYGNGYVFFTNPLLPNIFTVNNLSPQNEGLPLASTTNGANNLIMSYFAEFVSMEKYGYAVERTFGSFGTRMAAWELHYEDITGIANYSAVKFNEICRKYRQFPSYTLVRNPYVWFQRAESVTYVLNNDGVYSMDSYENMYSSGKHVVSSGEWISLDAYENTESYFLDIPEYVKRAYPCPIDFDGDGNMDIFCGSADGNIYYYGGNGMNSNYETGVQTYVTDTDGKPINVGAYSSPVICDIDADGVTELLSGNENGEIFMYKQYSGLAFYYAGKLADTGMTDAMIDCGDLNADGIFDLSVGSRNGELRIYYGRRDDNGNLVFDYYINVGSMQRWCAPCIVEENGGDVLYAGTFEGYIARYDMTDGQFVLSSYIEGDKRNMRGDNRIKFGNNCVPRFYDIDGDGDRDILSGSLEYGMAYPIDSEYFPYREELQEQIDYCKENDIYIGAHIMTSEYADTDHEINEFYMQKKAFESYGLDWSKIGANQHTWYTSKIGYNSDLLNGQNYNGTYKNEYESGILWNSGSQTPASRAVPQVSAENSIIVPFYLYENGKPNMMIMQPSNTPYGNGAYSYISAMYGVPMLFYDHCDYIYEDNLEQEEQIQKVDKLVRDYDYSFVGEDQMAKAIAASYNTKINAKWDGEKIVLSSEDRVINDKLYDENYQKSVGVKVLFSENIDMDSFNVDSNVWYKGDNEIYVSADRETVLSTAEKTDKLHIMNVNTPADVKLNRDSAVVKFDEGGIMQVTVEGTAYTSSDGWDSVVGEDRTIFTKYGDASSIKIHR